MKAVDLQDHLTQDSETHLWHVASSDVPGIRLEAEGVHELIRKGEDIAPEQVDLNREEIAVSHNRCVAAVDYPPRHRHAVDIAY